MNWIEQIARRMPSVSSRRISRFPVYLGVAAIVGVLLLGFGASALGAPATVHSVPAPRAGGAPSASPSLLSGPSTAVGSHAPAASSFTPPYSSHVIFNAPGPRPASWARSGTPPGAEVLSSLPSPAGSWAGGGSGSGAGSPSASSWDNRFCAGVWPGFPSLSGNPQSYYASDCYGHDEPGVQFYSTQPGSGGNVSWQVTLPVDRSPTLNQSNLYSALWFGMALTDPYAWMDQCFLELQFYPDQTFYNPGPMFPNWTVNGAWIGAAVAWQIEATTGFENPCFYEPLYLNGVPGPAFLNMTQGDHISISMTGWPGSTTGEGLSILDTSNGQSSNITLFNSTGNYPLNPSYVTNNYENGFEWTPGGEYPVVFAFETGHAGNFNWPDNNSFGGCSPGPTSTPADPAAPCPSYDPGSWANDTLAPWQIQVPTFFNSHHVDHPAQVAFTQDFGGVSLVSQLSGGACNGETGAAWCSYPWYSYSCATHSFAFGATDYTGVTSDFGKYNQYATNLQGNALGFGFYPPTNFSIPTCGKPSFSVSVGSTGTGGSAYFLSQAYTTATTVTGVGGGDYSLNAIPTAGSSFDHWSTTGGVSVAITTSAYTTVHVSGTGTLTAVFSTTPKMTQVKFTDTPRGRIGLDPSLTFNGPFTGTGNPLATLTNGASFSLAPGIYSVQAYPAPGYNFSFWSVSNGGAVIASGTYPYTWLTVTGTHNQVTVEAWYVKTNVRTLTEVVVFGNGTVTAGALTVTNVGAGPAFGIVHGQVGTHPLVATPGTGANSVLWLYGPSGVMTNFSMTTLINVEQGFTFIEAIFYDVEPLGLSSANPAGGLVSLLAPALPPTSSTTVSLGPGVYPVAADPASGYAFSGWSTTGGASVLSSSDAVTLISLTSAGSVIAGFTAASSVSTVNVGASGGSGGTVQFDGSGSYGTPVSLSSVSDGLHWVAATPAPGWVFSSWSLSGNVSTVGGPIGPAVELNVTGDASVEAVFTAGVFPVTFVAWEPEGSAASAATLTIGSTVLHTGETVWLATGAYVGTLAGNDDQVRLWTPTSNVTLTAATGSKVSFSVSGSGTIYVLIADSDHDSGSGGLVPAGGLHSSSTPGSSAGWTDLGRMLSVPSLRR